MAANLVNDDFQDELEGKLTRLRSGESLRVVDLFSGCGGMSLGLKRAHYTILGGVELNQIAISTYAKNLFKGLDQSTLEIHSTPHDITAFTPEMFLHKVL